MNARGIVRVAGAAVVTAAAVLTTPVGISAADAQPCPDAEVVFARGSGQPAGLGNLGEAFVDALRARAPGRSIEAYAVDYPASHDYYNSSLLGESDATAHIESVVTGCPNTKLVIGGYSQGASVTEMSTNSMPPQVVDHVAAVVLFGTPASDYSNSLWGAPLPALAAAYAPKTIDLCIPDDIICAEDGNMPAHLMYMQSGMVDEAATFAASRL